jgi:hypothetical protein
MALCAAPAAALLQVAVWDLSDLASPGSTTLRPTITTLVPPGDPQLAVKFNVNNPVEFITNGKRRVYFWQLPPRLAGGAMSFYSPPLKASDFSQGVGDFITSTFVPNSSQVGHRTAVPTWCPLSASCIHQLVCPTPHGMLMCMSLA